MKKPTSFLTNAPELGREFSARCSGRGGLCSRPEGSVHTQCRGKTARLAAIYHFKLCRANLDGFGRQLNFDGVCKDGVVGMLDARMDQTEVLPVLHVGTVDQIFDIEVDGDKVYRDDSTGQVLDPRFVREARQKELDFFESKGSGPRGLSTRPSDGLGSLPLPSGGWTPTRATPQTRTSGHALLQGRFGSPAKRPSSPLHPRSSP